MGVFGAAIVVMGVCCFMPYLFMDPTNFIPANRMITPVHIQPEWYFLFAYRILRAIPNKVGGVLALAGSVLVLYLLPFIHAGMFRGLSFYPCNQFLF